MTTSTDPWYREVRGAICGKSGCSTTATKVGVASPAFRVVTCDEHEGELDHIVLMMKENPNPDAPPAETVSWRRDDRLGLT